MDGPSPVDSSVGMPEKENGSCPPTVAATASSSLTGSSMMKKAAYLLPSWTPNTTRLLQAGGSSAWDILDHVMLDDDNNDNNFVDTLRTELQTTGLLHQLGPARTKGDVQMDHMLSLVKGQLFDTTTNAFFSDKHQQLPTRTESIRGDVNTWITREYRSHVNFEHRHPCLSRLVNCLQETAQHQLLMMSTNITLDLSLTSVQLAVYPGDGKSCYLRHCDRGDGQCAQESTPSNTPTKCGATAQRVVTAVYYVTPHDWNAQLDGGCLRLFDNDEDDSFYDVVPYANRFVVFRSDGVEHEVLPSLRRDRMALTIWLYGWVEPPSTGSPMRDNLIRTMDQNTVATSPATTQEEASVNSMDGPPPPLPLLETDATSENHETIFVSIAAYRDSETGPTIRSLMSNAQYPDRVHVGVVLQVDTQTDNDVHILDSLPQDDPWYYAPSHVRYLTLDARHAQGPCYARYLCQTLHREEDYVLQIDSHMRFRQNWDTYLIQQLQKCPGDKSMLTAYPVGYDLPDKVPNETRGTLLVPWKFDDTGMLRQKGRLMKPITQQQQQQDSSVLVPCLLYAAGFNFSRAAVLQDCPYDGRLRHLFFGEELSMAVRLYTHGYNLYAPPESVCYHLWSRAHRPSPLDLTTSNTVDRQKQREAAIQVVRQQLGGQGRGLGSVRTATEFAAALGVNFETQSISSETALGSLSSEVFVLDNYHVKQQGLDHNIISLATRPKALIASFLGNLQ